MMRKFLCFTLLITFMSPAVSAKYKIREIQQRAAAEYSAHQDFQGIVIGADVGDTEAKTLEFFDTRKLYEKGIVPVLIVIENNNDFAIRIDERDIFLIHSNETKEALIPYPEVLLHITLDNPLSTYSSRPEILFRRIRNKDMVTDFEHKAFDEKLIAPHSSDFGVVFFERPVDEDLSELRLFFPEVLNLTEQERLIFFEVRLVGEGHNHE